MTLPEQWKIDRWNDSRESVLFVLRRMLGEVERCEVNLDSLSLRDEAQVAGHIVREVVLGFGNLASHLDRLIDSGLDAAMVRRDVDRSREREHFESLRMAAIDMANAGLTTGNGRAARDKLRAALAGLHEYQKTVM